MQKNKELFYHQCAGQAVCVWESLQRFCLVSKQISQVSHCQHSSLRVLHRPAALATNTQDTSFLKPLFLHVSHKKAKSTNLFSAVFSIACILSSIVDLMRNLWTKVGLVDTRNSGYGTLREIWALKGIQTEFMKISTCFNLIRLSLNLDKTNYKSVRI